MRAVYVVLGFLFTGLGALGVMLPILPTTPFLLLALACFTKGSKRFSDWFTETKLYKNNIEDFVEDRSMTLRNKVIILAFASAMLSIPLIVVDLLWVRLFIVFLIVYKYYYFTFKIKTKPKEEINVKY